MGAVSYGQAGYVGTSMSVRARAAYESGEMPMSKWTRGAIISALKGGLLASLFGLLPTIGLGAEYLFINVTHGIDFATDGRLGEGRISGMISVLNINTLWLPLTGFLLLVPAVRNNKAARIAIACLQVAGSVININRGLDTQAFLELIIAAVAVLGISNYTAASNDLGDIDE